jgi:hypothetical protein
MAPHRNHVEARSSRIPARQFVSETHDHKPDAPSRMVLLQRDIEAMTRRLNLLPERSERATELRYRLQNLRIKQLRAEQRDSRKTQA